MEQDSSDDDEDEDDDGYYSDGVPHNQYDNDRDDAKEN